MTAVSLAELMREFDVMSLDITVTTPTALVEAAKDYAAMHPWPQAARMKLTGSKRTTSQNALYWMWMPIFAKQFNLQPCDQYPDVKEKAHDVCRNMFLGTTDKRIGKMTIKGQLISTTSLSKSEMAEYMTKIQAWCAYRDVNLPIPEECEYREYFEARN